MQRFGVIFLCVVSIWALPLESSSVRNLVPFKDLGPRIINGDKAAKGQFPWQVAIFVAQSGVTNLCGGALIDSGWILTAGHCVQGATSFTITLGSTTLTGTDPDRVVLTATEYIQHENYSSLSLANDIALIPLKQTVTVNDNIQPIALPSSPLDDGSTVTVSGWGLTSDGGDGASNDLNYVDLVTIPDNDCREVFGSIGDGVVCAQGQGDVVHSTCEGDSGGPLVADASGDPVLVGVVSFGHSDGCESGKPAGFARTYYYRDWIEGKTGISN
jgi:secreted trypsin-like serine protease